MNADPITQDFRERVCEQIELLPEGESRFRVLTPFRFEDGDHFGIVLKREADRWILSDEAHTLMHLSYWLDEKELEKSGNRQEIILGSLASFSVEDRNGELIIPVSDARFGDALFNFVQAISKVSDVSFLSRERVRSTFMEDLKTFLQSRVPADRLGVDWTEPIHDPKQYYRVDYRVNNIPRPLFIYGLPSNARVKDATINLLRFENWGLKFQSLGIFEDQGEIDRMTLAKFTDVCDGLEILSYDWLRKSRQVSEASPSAKCAYYISMDSNETHPTTIYGFIENAQLTWLRFSIFNSNPAACVRTPHNASNQVRLRTSGLL